MLLSMYMIILSTATLLVNSQSLALLIYSPPAGLVICSQYATEPMCSTPAMPVLNNATCSAAPASLQRQLLTSPLTAPSQHPLARYPLARKMLHAHSRHAAVRNATACTSPANETGH